MQTSEFSGRSLARSLGLPTVWQPGEHVAIVGDTGSGKTFLVSKLTQLRRYVVMLRTKPDTITFDGFRPAQTADAMDYWNPGRILLQPKLSRQAREVKAALQRTWVDGGWTTVVDELWYAERRLGVSRDIETLLTQGRSKEISMIVGMQRPSQVSRFAIAECTHLFCFRLDGRDVKTVGEASTRNIERMILGLQRYDFVYFHRGLRAAVIGNANDLGGIFKNPVR